jgi:hypothetical protein
MRLISYARTPRFKRIFWLGAIALIGIVSVPSILDGSVTRNPLVSLTPLLILGGFWIYFLRRSGVFRLADEIFDCADHLKIRRGDLIEEVPFYNISGVDVSTGKPNRISIRFVTPNSFGSNMEFLPEYVPRTASWSIAEMNRVAAALRERADRARAARLV